jgi:hypothetical protein
VDHHGCTLQIVARGGVAIRAAAVRAQRERLLDEHGGTGGEALALGRRQPEIDRYRDGSEQQAGMERPGEGGPRRQRDRDAPPGTRAARDQLGRARACAGEQLGVGEGAIRRL